MSFSFVSLMMLLGSSFAVAFVLQPSREEQAASANLSALSHRCQGESLLSIRKRLLKALNLQIEPLLPNKDLNAAREQWRTTLSNIAARTSDVIVPAVPAVPSDPVSPDGGNDTGLKCCPMASEVFMKDLGWDNWMILPLSVTIVHCALCNPEGNIVQCPSFHANVPDCQEQVHCCQPISPQSVEVLYVDGSGTVLSSMELPSGCGCSCDVVQQPSEQ